MLSLLLATGALLGWLILYSRPTPADVERRVRSELPLGSTRSSVEAWLNQNGIHFVAVEGAIRDSYHGQYGVRTVVQEARLTDSQIGASIRAIVENVNVNLAWWGEVDVYFFFEHQGLLIGHAFMPWIDAP